VLGFGWRREAPRLRAPYSGLSLESDLTVRDMQCQCEPWPARHLVTWSGVRESGKVALLGCWCHGC
jgi:hypothetical protein